MSNLTVVPNEGCCRTTNVQATNQSNELHDMLIKRMNRIEGQIKGVKNMMSKQAYCDDILQQISAARAALDSVSRVLLESHIKTCVIERMQEGDSKIIEEFLATISKITK